MVKRDKEYKKIENITLGCYAVGLWLACVTKFLPFILLTVTVVKRMYWEYSNSWSYGRNLGASVTAWQPLPESYKKVIR